MIETRQSLTSMTRALGAVVVCALAAGCAMSPTPFTQAEFEAKASADRTALYTNQAPLVGPLTLSEAIARVLHYNLDRRALVMEEALALGQLQLDSYDLLPQLVAGAGYAGRDEYNASTSKELLTGKASDATPTYSQDKHVLSADLGATWNILDFGVSWYTARQNTDRALIASERRRKAVAALVQELRYTFWRAAAAQRLGDRVTETLTQADIALANLERVETERLRPPTQVLQQQKALLEAIRRLEAMQRELSAAKAQLAALINQPPGSPILLAIVDPDQMQIPDVPVPIKDLEMAALINNPDLREQVYLGRIAVEETRKEILRLLPGISLDFSRQADSNSFLAHNYWNQWGVQLTWNLLNIVSAPDRIAQAETTEEVATARRLALRMAVLAQVHVISHELAADRRQFHHADRLWRIETRLAETSGTRQAGGALDPVQKIAADTSAMSAELRRYQTFAQAQMAYGKLMATVGVDPVPDTVAAYDLPNLAQAIADRMDALARGEAWMDAPVTAPITAPAAERDDPETAIVPTPSAPLVTADATLVES